MCALTAAVDHGAADRVLTLPDGRRLGYREYGCPNGRPVVALHGTPGSRFKFSDSHEAATREGLRLIAVDRWGYGLSSSKPGARLVDYGADVTALANALALNTFQVVGVSGGAPFAVAIATQLKQRVTELALVSPVGPIIGAKGRVELSPFHVFCFCVLPVIPGAIRSIFQLYRGGLWLAPNWAMWLAVSRSAAVDRRVMTDLNTRKRLIKAFSNGLQHGTSGPETDMDVFGRLWGLDLSAITARTCVWIGAADRNVPMTAVADLAATVPDGRLVVLPDEGHLWIANNAHVVMGWLTEPR